MSTADTCDREVAEEEDMDLEVSSQTVTVAGHVEKMDILQENVPRIK